VQTRAAPEVRGRAVSLYLLAAVGPLPLAFALGSAAGDLLGPRSVLALAAVLAVAAGVLGLLARPVRELSG
jgi:hypothetical protein